MPKFIDLTGNKYGKLTVLQRAPSRNKKTYWTCQCECGTIKDIVGDSLKSGKTKSCGCTQARSIKEMTGLVFGRLTAIGLSDIVTKGQCRKWICQCECGKIVEVNGDSLRAGKTKSCGCLSKEKVSARSCLDITNQKFGFLTAIEPTDKRLNNSVVWKCQCECGNFIEASVNHLRAHDIISCGCARNSLGEKVICDILSKNNIAYEQEKTFETCVNPTTNKLLRFDFFINNQYLVEFDGEQHYKYKNSGWNNKEYHTALVERDELKNQWCKNNHIPLIRIPYTKLDTLSITDLVLTTTEYRVV